LRPLFFVMYPSLRSTALITCGALIAVLILAWLAYRPGLAGGFLFDDFANLPLLGETGPVDNAATFSRYITSGSADPTGRPLSLLSFLIDADDWPADPYPFKRTSVLLHLLDGVLLFGLLTRLGQALGKTQRHVALAAVLGSALWLLHPLLVSTTLYIVQRETMLPATFVLLGLIGYVHGRELAASGRRAGVVLAATSIVVCTVLAMLSKANGVLLPLFAWIVESIVLQPNSAVEHRATRRAFAVVRRSLLITPSLLLFAYLAKIAYGGFVNGMPAIRPWTLGERLLTEGRVLVDYLRLLWLPRPFTTGLFNDAFPISNGILSPPSTLLCLLLIFALLVAAWTQRRRHPAFALAILFFFAGQLLESTVVPLELYFEHRNYLPALMMFWPLALWICNPGITTNDRSATAPLMPTALRMLLAIVLPLGLAGMTWVRAGLWGDERSQAIVWADKNPDSPRAQAYAAQIELDHGQVAAATARLERALAKHPGELQLALNMLGAECSSGVLLPADIERAAVALRTAPNAGRLGFDWFERGLSMARSGTCHGLDLETLDRLLVAAGQNERTEKVPGRLQDRLHLQGRIALLRSQDERALRLFDAALDADIRPGAALNQAAILATAHRPLLAQRHLDHLMAVWRPPAGPGWSMPTFHDWLLWKEGYWAHEIVHMRTLLAKDVAAAPREGGKKIPTGSPTKSNEGTSDRAGQ